MLKTVLAAAVAIFCASSLQAAEIYNKDGNKLNLSGKLDGLHYFSKNKGVDGDQSYFRPLISGESQISSELVGYGQWEYHFWGKKPENDSGQSGFTRYAFAGLRYGNLGSLDYGRNNGILYDISAWTDTLPEFGGDTFGYTDNFMTKRSGGVLTWRNSDFFGLLDGLNIAAQYQGKNGGAGETNNGRGYRAQNGDGFGVAASWYTGMGISIGAAYSNARRSTEQIADLHGDKAEAWDVGLKYDHGGVYLAAMYAQSRNMTPFGNFNAAGKYGFANKTDNLELVAQYHFDFGLMPSLAYLQSHGTNLQINGTDWGSEDLVKYLDIAAAYNFNKNMKVYVDYKVNLLKTNKFTQTTGISTDNVLALALMYKF